MSNSRGLYSRTIVMPYLALQVVLYSQLQYLGDALSHRVTLIRQKNGTAGHGVLIENNGKGQLTLDSNCFIGNTYGNALVTAYEGETFPKSTNNYGSENKVVHTMGLECEFRGRRRQNSIVECL